MKTNSIPNGSRLKQIIQTFFNCASKSIFQKEPEIEPKPSTPEVTPPMEPEITPPSEPKTEPSPEHPKIEPKPTEPEINPKKENSIIKTN